ncbi:aminopeptidase N-like [Ooceraea biroi]|uniref:aminopeptidase N-like n=1 Tax=Ooceraea biroi TaxID=2015173 RepID=UPI0009716843|nr:aminopeptidase N-like [Ooceraea biroi]
MMHVNMDNPELGNSTMKYIMGNCVRENNYPIVNVRRTEHTLEISQYQDEYHIDEHYRQKVLQWIPTTFTTWEELDFNNMTHHWIPPKDSTKYNISVPITTKNGWIILNLQQTGYYRVKYDDKSLDAITYYLRFMEYEDIHVLNRAQIIDDTYYFLKRGEITYGRFLHLIYYLREERDYVAWYPMFQMFRDISCFLPFEESAPLKVR